MSKHQVPKEEMDFIINCVRFGPWVLGQPIVEAYETNTYLMGNERPKDLLTELKGTDLEEFRGAGAAPEYGDERLFETKEYSYFGINNWTSILATHEGQLYKNGVRYLGQTDNVKVLFNEMIKMFADQAGMGKPKRSIMNKDRCEWNNEYSKIIMKFRSIPQQNLAQVNIIIRAKQDDIFQYIMDSETV